MARYDIDGVCPKCGSQFDAWYAPTSGFIDHECRGCGFGIDLESYTGIDAESTASTKHGAEYVRSILGRSDG